MERGKKLSLKDVSRLALATRDGFKGVTTELESIASTQHLNRIIIDVPLLNPVIIINHPDDVDDIWKAHQANLDKQGSLYDAMREMFGSGHVLSKRNDLWSTLKKLSTPPLRPQNIDQLEERTTQIVDETLDYYLQSSQTNEQPAVNIHRALKTASAQISTKILFGIEFPVSFMERLTQEITLLNDYVSKNVAVLKLTEKVRKAIPHSFEKITQAYELLIMSVEKILDEGDSALMTSLRAHGPQGDKRLTRDEQIGEIINTLVASYGNIANSIAWSAYFLSLPENEILQKHIIDEYEAGIKPHDANSTTRKVMNEALRLYSPVYLISRQATSDLSVVSENGAMTIPKGSKVIFSPYLMHRNPQVWQDPTKFDPQRFEGTQKKNAFLPFGYGERACTGVNFSYQVGTEILEHLVLKYQFSLDETANPTPIFLTNVSPRDVNMKISKRNYA